MEKKSGLSEARAAVLSLAKLHFGHPERAREFFNQSLLEDSSRSQEADTPAT